MSYSVINSCWNCVKKEKCTDPKKIQAAVTDIHSEFMSTENAPTGHMDSGSIIIQCHRFDAKEK